MRPTGLGVRWVARVVIIVLGAVLLQSVPASAADGAAVTIHSRICPVGFAGPDYYTNCHDSPLAEVTFTLSLAGTGAIVEATTATDGNLDFVGLPYGTYIIEDSVPGEFAAYAAYCSDQNQNAVPFAYTDTGGIQFDLNVAGIAVTCDWYVAPYDLQGDTEASVTIYNALCPVGYQGVNYFDDCYQTPLPGIDFTFQAAGSSSGVNSTTNANGFVAFEGISIDGNYVISESIPGEFNRFVVFCSANDVPFPFSYPENTNGILLALTTADDVRCDWYNIPEDLRGDAPPPAKPSGPIARLPSTGVGVMAGHATDEAFFGGWVLVLGAIVALGRHLVYRCDR